MTAPVTSLVDELSWRGLVHQCTDEAGLRSHLGSGVRSGYVGFDPTADSLTIGNLVPAMMLVHLQRAGHRPVVVMGGGTGLIGDPSGKSAERELISEDRVAANVKSQMRVFDRLLDFSTGPVGATLVNNADWLKRLSYLEVLRDVGKHFSINQMIQRDSVKARLHEREQGISYTEFSYMVLQAYDFLHLHRAMGVTLQMGGSDQYGNILSGCDLIRRQRGEGAEEQSEEKRKAAPSVGEAADISPAGGEPKKEHGAAFGLVAPLVTKADGGKFGKTESGAVWLTAERTSPYAYYQFWLNSADADAGKYLRIFTLLPRAQIEAAEQEQAANPASRATQRLLAREATSLLHGRDEMQRAEGAAAALFSGEIARLSPAILEEVLASAPSKQFDRSRLDGEGLALLDVLAETICKSKSEARQALSEGSVSVNGVKAGAADRLTAASLLHGTLIALRRGKKTWFVTRWA